MKLRLELGDNHISILLYADDMVSLSDSEEKLQKMLNDIFILGVPSGVFQHMMSKVALYSLGRNIRQGKNTYLGLVPKLLNQYIVINA